MTGLPAPPAGTPAERTGLAWRRTALAATGFAAVALKAAINHQGVLDSLTAALAMLSAVTLYLCGRSRESTPTARISSGVMAIAVTACLAANASAAVMVVTGR